MGAVEGEGLPSLLLLETSAGSGLWNVLRGREPGLRPAGPQSQGGALPQLAAYPSPLLCHSALAWGPRRPAPKVAHVRAMRKNEVVNGGSWRQRVVAVLAHALPTVRVQRGDAREMEMPSQGDRV